MSAAWLAGRGGIGLVILIACFVSTLEAKVGRPRANKVCVCVHTYSWYVCIYIYTPLV